MNTRTAACTALLALTTLTGCSSDSDEPVADPAACKAALDAQYLQAVAEGEPSTLPVWEKLGAPDDCAGVSRRDIHRYAWGIVGKHGMDGYRKSLDDLEDAVDEYASRLASPQP